MAAETEIRDVLARVLIANDGEVLSRLRLSAAEAARVCNVTPRQLIYWTKKGLVKPSADGEHDYDVYAMEKVIRIRQALGKGYSLEKAAQLVQRDLTALQTTRSGSMTSTEDLEGSFVAGSSASKSASFCSVAICRRRFRSRACDVPSPSWRGSRRWASCARARTLKERSRW